MLQNKASLIKARALAFQKARAFFQQKNILEVDCPLLSPKATIDTNVDPIPAIYQNHVRCFLRPSPEYPMKRLLCEGSGDIYQLGHVYRNGERGSRHNPEFTMAEWYRIDMDFDAFLSETLEFISLFTGLKEICHYTYRAAMQTFAGIDPWNTSTLECRQLLLENNFTSHLSVEDDLDEWLYQIMSLIVEPQLPKNSLNIIKDYPPTQAALSVIEDASYGKIAKRFEIYHGSLELANGYLELSNAKDQLLRLEEANQKRLKEHKDLLPIDTYLIEALEKGLPNCCGVAVGFDRLLMCQYEKQTIDEVILFSWENS